MRKTTAPFQYPIDGNPSYRFTLFVAGNEPNSLKAMETLAQINDRYLTNAARIRVIDVFEDYQSAIDHHIVVVPTLVIHEPPPERVIVGSLTDEAKLVDMLGITNTKSG